MVELASTFRYNPIYGWPESFFLVPGDDEMTNKISHICSLLRIGVMNPSLPPFLICLITLPLFAAISFIVCCLSFQSAFHIPVIFAGLIFFIVFLEVCLVKKELSCFLLFNITFNFIGGHYDE